MIEQTVDRSHATLHDLGWSCGDMAFREAGRVTWMVYAHRGGEKIVVQADSRGEAWEAAAGQAERLMSA